MEHDTLRPLVTRRNFVRGLGLLGASSALAACGATDGGVVASTEAATPAPLLAIIHTNDVHGHVVAAEGAEGSRGNFSMAAVSALRRDWEGRGYEVLLVDAGDALQGTPVVDISNGARIIEVMNACGYDLMAVGNHEFDWGVEALAANERDADFPFLSASVLDRETGELRFAPNTTFELKDGTLVGFFGLTTPTTRTTTQPSNVAGMTFLDGDDLISCAREQVRDLRSKGADIVVCVGHLGGESSRQVLEAVEGIDLFIDGHDHQEVMEEVAGTLLVETGCFLHNIGVVTIDEGLPDPELVAAGTYDGIDGEVQALIDEADAEADEALGEVMGTTPFTLYAEVDPSAYQEETNLGDFCSDAMRWKASLELGREVDAAIMNGGAIRKTLTVGDMTLKDVKTALPFNDLVVVISVTGSQLLEAIEAGCQNVGGESGFPGFPQVSGIECRVDATVPYERGEVYPDSTFHSPANIGARVTIGSVGGRPFGESERYSLAIPDFLAEGGDSYHVLRVAAEAEEPVVVGFDYGCFAQYLLEACDGVVPDDYAEPRGQGRITIIGMD